MTIRANGSTQNVLIPSLASSITAVELLKNDVPNTDDQELKIKYWVNANGTSNWKGPRGNIPAKSVLYSAKDGDADLDFKLSPANVDGTGVEFALVNSRDGYAPLKLTTPANNKELISRASTYNNGMYQTSVGEKSEIFTYTVGASDFTNQFDADSKKVMFALTPNITGTNVRSPYQVKVNYGSLLTAATINEVWINGADENADSKKYDVTIESTNDVATIRVGKEASVTVDEPSNLYDMYMEVTDAAKDKFGLEIDNEARTITATKSPDDLTDATFDLNVYVMDNAGNQYDVTTIKVTVNRTMAVAAYDKQVKDLTKLDDTFTVSATPLFNSLGSQLNDWKESVGLGNTKIELLEMNAAGDLVAAAEQLNNFKGGSTVVSSNKVVSSNADLNDGNLAFLTADNKNATAANLANIRFNLNIQKAAADKPLKIDKDYYIRLSFYSNASTPTLLNTITIPFVLNKPELSEILVKESGVFVDGDDLAYAYMYWGDAYGKDGNIIAASGTNGPALSRYYIDRAFTNMYDNLSKAGMTPTFTVDAQTKIEGNKTSSDLAELGESNRFTQTDRWFVQLKDVDSDNNDILDGYKKDLIVNFTGNYLDVKDDSYKYTHTYKFRVMSPILEGRAYAANDLLVVSATGRTRLHKEDIWAKTNNDEVQYNIFRTVTEDGTKNVWYRDDIANVTFSSGNTNVFVMTQATPSDVQYPGTNKEIDSYIEVEGLNNPQTTTLNVAIEDIWGYTLEDQVNIQTTRTPLSE